MLSVRQRIGDYFEWEIWAKDLSHISKPRLFQIKTLRLAYVIFKSVSDEQLALRATGLLYTILLTIVPLLAVSFSVVKAFGVDAKLLILLYYFLEPLGPSGVDISMKVIEFVGNVKASVLGSIGLAMLIYTVISTIQKMESSLNYIWQIRGTRAFLSRLSNYISVLLISPVLALAAFGSTASLMSSGIMKKLSSVAALGVVFQFAGRAIPYVLICVAFTLIYYSLPNTKVRLRPAVAGGIAAGVLWQTTGWLFAAFVASSAHYSAIYSGFAALILLLIWLYWSFLILLVGARVSFYSQHPGLFAVGQKTFIADNRLKEKTAVTAMYLIGHSFYHGGPQWTLNSIAEQTGLPLEILREVIEALRTKGLVLSSCDEPPGFAPAKDLEKIAVREVIESVRMSQAEPYAPEMGQPSFPEVEKTMKLIDEAIVDALKKETVATLVKRHPLPDK